MYDGLIEVDDFLNKFEREVLEQQRFDALKWVLCVTPPRWWGTHQQNFEDWQECIRMMRVRFGAPQMQLIDKYDGWDDPRAHLVKWTKVYEE